MADGSPKFIRCRFCGWKTSKWVGKKGPTAAFARLRRHIDADHYAEGERIRDSHEEFAEDNPFAAAEEVV